MDKKKVCGTCKYHANYEGVCCNADSEYVADFTSEYFQCEQHEYAKSENR